MSSKSRPPSPESLQSVFDDAAVGIAFVDESGTLHGVNPAFRSMMKSAGIARIPGKFGACLHRDDRDALAKSFGQLFSGDHESVVAEMRFGARSSRPRWGRVILSLASNRRAAEPLAIAIIDDITERKRTDDHLSYLASHDALTGLPNRVLFGERLERALARAKRNNLVVAVLFLDLDHFKQINDSYGHQTGDLLLKQVARRIETLVRREDTIARLSGDEFTVILEGIGDFRYASTVAQKILQRLGEPFDLGGQIVSVSASIGVSLYPADGNSAATLVRKADKAMYVAKKQGRGTFRSASIDLSETAYQRDALTKALRDALTASGGLELYYQPVVLIGAGKIVRGEALLRWNHPVIGLMTPSQFLPLAIESGLVPDILRWVLTHAISEIAALRKAGRDDLRISVNLSRAELLDPAFLDIVGQAIAKSPESARSLDFDISQAVLNESESTIATRLGHLRDIGTRIALDDLSAAEVNSSLPIDVVKLSANVVQMALDRGGAHQHLKKMLDSFHQRGIEVVAKAVENSAQTRLLEAAGCVLGQGYLFGRPLPGPEFLDLVTRADKTAKPASKA
jgi:diguanylate cyclase (GGDEF)-like protein/PAS domain S-box-containing protein